MFFKQYYLGCLAHASYLIASQGIGAVIDPQRDVDQYLDDARKEGIEIKYILETHLHADFVSGHRELAEKTGAQIVFGKSASYQHDHIKAQDGYRITFGDIELSFIETPGHTPESICIMAKDKSDESSPAILFTGDTLFVGDVGRPDLVGSKGYSAEQMAAMMYESIHDKILILPEETLVYPAHGAGSLCGKNLSTEKSSTIGREKKFNYALREMKKEDFVKLLTTDQPEVPAYFPIDVELNRQGAQAVEDISMPEPISAEEVREYLKNGAAIIDLRDGKTYSEGHIKGSININLTGQFASWAGTLIAIETTVILVADSKKNVEEAVVRLARIGIETVAGYLENGMKGWLEADFPVNLTEVISVDELSAKIQAGEKLQILDVRRPQEYFAGHAPHAINIPLAELKDRVEEIPNVPLAVICASGYRSSIAISLLVRAGRTNLMNIAGGTKAWINAGFQTEGKPATCVS